MLYVIAAEQETLIMKNALHIVFALMLIAPMSAFSQEGEGEEIRKDNSIERIELSRTKEEGLQVKVHTIDSISGEVKDTTTIKFKHSTVYIVTENNKDSLDPKELSRECKRDLTYWAGIDLGINGFLSPSGDVDLGKENDYLELDYPQSRSLSINFYEQKLRLIKDYVGITTGAGIQWNSYRLANDYTLSTTKDTLFAIMDSSINLKKNKFRTTWINVPLLLEFNTSKTQKNNVHVSAGVVGGIHLGTMYKQKYTSEGVKSRYKTKNDFNVAPYKLEAMVRLGYGSFNLFASYQLTELFEKGKGPELYPFTLGLTMLAF
jgi:hypothetical protein